MRRDEMLRTIRDRREPWDIAVIGGGATGAGVAVDAAARGFDVVLVEAHDFGKGTSSRSTASRLAATHSFSQPHPRSGISASTLRASRNRFSA